MTPVHVKKLKNQTLLVEVDKRKMLLSYWKWLIFHTINVKTYPHKSLNISKGVVHNDIWPTQNTGEVKSRLHNGES